MQIHTIPVERDSLGESPVWDERTRALYWSDQLGKRVRRFEPAISAYREWPVPKTLGSLALTEDENVLLVVLCDGFYRLDLSDRKSTRLNSSHERRSRMPSSA